MLWNNVPSLFSSSYVVRVHSVESIQVKNEAIAVADKAISCREIDV